MSVVRVIVARCRPLRLAWPLALVLAAACGGSPSSPSADVAFQTIDLQVGTGTEAVAGRTVRVHYTGWLYDPSRPDNKGTQVDSSIGGDPLSFILGAGQVIRGWDMGIVGMRVGGRRRLVIPPSLAYGSAGAGGVIPPNAALVFDVELVSVQ